MILGLTDLGNQDEFPNHRPWIVSAKIIRKWEGD